MSNEEINLDYSQYSKQELYTFLDQGLSSDKKNAILNELLKRFKSSFEDTVFEASQLSEVPPEVPPQYRREDILPVVPTNPSGGKIGGSDQNNGSQAIIVIIAVVVGIGMLMAGM